MPVITFIKSDNSEHQIEVRDGVSLMEAGRDSNMGIEGTCGGSLSCASCHVYFDQADYEKLGVPSEDEVDMLDLSFNLTPTSRLGCQIRVSEALSGLRVLYSFGFLIILASKVCFMSTNMLNSLGISKPVSETRVVVAMSGRC
jgi:2Fe-2S ferredoxin